MAKIADKTRPTKILPAISSKPTLGKKNGAMALAVNQATEILPRISDPAFD